jgi:2-iminoacetate synthase ThiH
MNERRKDKMPGRPFDESLQIRTWIESALEAGALSPVQVSEWIEKHAGKDEEPPTLATIGRILREMGYQPTRTKWEKIN